MSAGAGGNHASSSLAGLSSATTATSGDGQVATGTDESVRSTIGSPLKKHRPSINAGNESAGLLPPGSNPGFGEILKQAPAQTTVPPASTEKDEEEEL